MFETTRRKMLAALGAGTSASVAGCASQAPGQDPAKQRTSVTRTLTKSAPKQVDVDQVAADPTDLPAPIDRDEPTTHDVELTVEEVTAEIEPGVTFDFMTFDGQIPGPMIRVRQGDTVNFTMNNAPENNMQHNVDMHAVYGTGGGAVATTAAPGASASETVRLDYPGAYIYHCAVPNMDYHISAGMFGMILVEPEAGLPEVDQELYFGQHDVYTDTSVGTEGHHGFDFEAMKDELPTYVLLNGEKYAYADARYGPVTVDKGDRVRVFMVNGGPNLTSSFHPIGNVWSEAYRDGAIGGPTEHNVQTMSVPPGSCMIGEMDTPVPERIKLVDHALTRVARRGMLAEIDVEGEEEPDIFDPAPDVPAEEDEPGPFY